MEAINAIYSAYNTNSVLFYDEAGEKVGMKDILGNILIPAKYDEVAYLYDSIRESRESMVAVRDGKFGLVKVDGSGEELTEFKYEAIIIMGMAFFNSYMYRREGCDKWGIMLSDGTELTDCIIDTMYEPTQFFYFESNGKKGMWLGNDTIIEPVYDDIEVIDVDEPILFTKDGVEGFVKYDGTFVTKEEHFAIEDLDERDDAENDYLAERCE